MPSRWRQGTQRQLRWRLGSLEGGGREEGIFIVFGNRLCKLINCDLAGGIDCREKNPDNHTKACTRRNKRNKSKDRDCYFPSSCSSGCTFCFLQIQRL